jgi:hypothetical protein
VRSERSFCATGALGATGGKTEMSFIEYGSLIRDFIIDFTALYFFAYVILYRKFRNKELFFTFSLFNIFMLMVIMAITRTNFNIALGFGLFALLSMVQLRSLQFTKAEMAYLFGGVSLAVINGAGIPDLSFVLTCNFIIIASTWIISGWSIGNSAYIIEKDNIEKMAVVLDQIDEASMRNHENLRHKLSTMFNLDIVSFDIKKIDYLNDVTELQIAYQVTAEDALQFPEIHDSQATISEFPVRPVAPPGE